MDMTGVIEWVSGRYGPRQLFLIGHSFGGQVAGLLSNSDRTTAVVTLSAQSGYWGIHPSPEKYRVWFLVCLAFPILFHTIGYLPWSRFAPGEDLPRGVALERASWCRSPDCLLGDQTLESLRNSSNFSAPILAYSIADDVWGSKPSVDAMMARYTDSPVERRHVSSEDIGGSRIGHLGFFRPTGHSL